MTTHSLDKFPMASPISDVLDALLTLRPEEQQRLEKRRAYVRDYDPPKWRSSHTDPVSGSHVERLMVPHASIPPSLAYCIAVWRRRKYITE